MGVPPHVEWQSDIAMLIVYRRNFQRQLSRLLRYTFEALQIVL